MLLWLMLSFRIGLTLWVRADRANSRSDNSLSFCLSERRSCLGGRSFAFRARSEFSGYASPGNHSVHFNNLNFLLAIVNLGLKMVHSQHNFIQIISLAITTYSHRVPVVYTHTKMILAKITQSIYTFTLSIRLRY